MARDFYGAIPREDMQDDSFSIIGQWAREAGEALRMGEVEAFIYTIDSLYSFSHTRLDDHEKINEELLILREMLSQLNKINPEEQEYGEYKTEIFLRGRKLYIRMTGELSNILFRMRTPSEEIVTKGMR